MILIIINEKLCLLKYLVNKTGRKNNTVENIKHFKIQHLFDNQTNTADYLKVKTPKNTPLIPACKYIKSTPGCLVLANYANYLK